MNKAICEIGCFIGLGVFMWGLWWMWPPIALLAGGAFIIAWAMHQVEDK